MSTYQVEIEESIFKHIKNHLETEFTWLNIHQLDYCPGTGRIDLRYKSFLYGDSAIISISTTTLVFHYYKYHKDVHEQAISTAIPLSDPQTFQKLHECIKSHLPPR